MNRIRVPDERLKLACNELVEGGGFDLISGVCSKHGYRLVFTKLRGDEAPEIIAGVTGSRLDQQGCDMPDIRFPPVRGLSGAFRNLKTDAKADLTRR